MLVAAAVLTVAVPAYAAENTGAGRTINKGTKSYQTARTKTQDKAAHTSSATPEDVSQIAPAAGDTMEKPSNTKNMKEALRLPRKN